MCAGGFEGGSRRPTGRPRARDLRAGGGKQAASKPPGLWGGGRGGCAEEAEESQFLAAFSFEFEIRSVWGVTLRGFILLPLIPAATTPSFPKRPQAWSGGVRGAPRRAPTRALPAAGSPFLLSFHSPRPDCLPPPPTENGPPEPISGQEFDLVLPRDLELSGRLSLPCALWRNWRRRSLRSPAAKPPPCQVLTSFFRGCEQELPCPALQVLASPLEEIEAALRAVAPGFPRREQVFGISVGTIERNCCLVRQSGTRLPSAHSSLQAVTFHPSIRQHARE